MELSAIVKGSAALSVLFLVSLKAEAADRFAMTCLENKTDITLNYSTRWGKDGRWDANSISPGKRKWHTWEYDQGRVGYSPDLHISFDENLSKRVKRREYVLKSFRSPQQGDCERYGKEYQFRYDGSARNYIDIVGIR